ncbi:MAG: alpha/beta hydrolase [Litorimonas sp.]
MARFVLSLALVLSSALAAQADDKNAFDPTGYWTGAVVREGSVLPVSVTIERTLTGFEAETLFQDWYFYKPNAREPAELTDNGLVIRDFLSGDAVLRLEPRFEQLIGHIGDEEGDRSLHLKRSPPPPAPMIESADIHFGSLDGTRLSGTLTLPLDGEALGAMVMVRGRGCASRVNGRARFFARYGMAVLTYDKRGAGQSEGDCATFDHDDLTDDALAALDVLAAQDRVDAQKVGFFAESAGAWTVQAATERRLDMPESVQPAFIVTWIGPATSILQQQISSAETYGAGIGLTPDQRTVLAEATEIIADESLSGDAAFAKLDVIRRNAEAEGWLDRGFGPDDIPRSRDEMDGLWLRRFRYDPGTFFARAGDLPYLSVLGAKDTIVPVRENAERLRRDLPKARIHIVDEAGHGYDHDGQRLPVGGGESMWVFEGPDEGFTVETIRFLREIGIMSR